MNKVKALVAMVAVAAIVPATLFAWGPSRREFTTAVPADYVTFNSITDNPSHGDERDFVQVRDANSSNTTYSNSISVTPGGEYVVYVYFHNNAAANLNEFGIGVAQGAYVKAQIPAVVANGGAGTKAVGYVGSTNARPAEVWDDITFTNTTGGDIALRYVPDSTVIHSKGAVNGVVMPNNILSASGTPLGYYSLNGVLPGCNEYAGYITFRVKADQPNFTVTKEVHKTGVTGWKETEAVTTKDSVDFLITYKNTGTTQQNDVLINDILPAGLAYTAGSTSVANTTNPKGITVGDNITKGGINIGDYAPGAAAYIRFSATVTATEASLPACGVNSITNLVKVQTNNGTKEDTANVTMNKVCKNTPPELPKTGTGENMIAILGLGTLVTTIGYYVASRRTSVKL